MKYVLYNPHSGIGACEEVAKKLSAESDCRIFNMTEISEYKDLFEELSSDDSILILGGDGTLNRFVNDVKGLDIPCKIYYLPTGSGNDFAKDVAPDSNGEAFEITKYLQDLPTVTVNGESHLFINGVGYGIDGYCCEVGDKLKAEGKKVDYTAIAIKGLLFAYKPTNATVIVDGVEHSFKKVWIAPTMKGRCYGGGMMPTPDQKRESDELSVMIFHGTGKIGTLMIFPSIFKGEHIKHKKAVTVLSGKRITVKYDRPTPHQIDGETVLGVSEYTAESANVFAKV